MSKAFITEDFMLQTKASRRLYHDYAAGRPIVDYHCHLSPKDIAENRRFKNLTEIWLEGDHYKWRAMRANGEPEKFCTGKADPYEKFLAFARTVPNTLRNPLYHWTHLELKRYFGIDDLLDAQSAPHIWAKANECLAAPGMDAFGILKKFNVELVGTTDDPCDDLAFHKTIAKSGCTAKVAPTFRPDKAMALGDLAAWNKWVDRLGGATDIGCNTLPSFLQALDNRLDYFVANGCKATDHGHSQLPARIAGESEAAATFLAARAGRAVDANAVEGFTGFVLAHLGESIHDRGLVMQLHLGPARNVNAAMMRDYGPDAGCDTIGDYPQGAGLLCLLGELSARGKLPKTVLYNLNPADNHLFAAMCGNFFEEGISGKMQYGSGWWFLDQNFGIRAQIDALSSQGLLGNFIGMLTDSRSFMSYCRHEYFRRVLCDVIGRDMENGLIPEDFQAVGAMIEAISHKNAEKYLGLVK
jgi:glucuronate isomerase